MTVSINFDTIKKQKLGSGLIVSMLAITLIAAVFLSKPEVALFVVYASFAIVIFFIIAMLFLTRKSNEKADGFSVPTISEYPTIQEAAPLPVGPREWSTRLLSEMEWKKFEQLCLAYFQLKDVSAKLIKNGTRGFIELKLNQATEVNAIVQHKTSLKDIGVKEIKELLALMTRAQVSKGFYMTASSFSAEAKEFAKEHKVTLISGGMLLTMLKRLRNGEQKRLLATATEGDYRTPTCPACDVKMISRHGPHQDKYYWGCIYKPRCKHIMPRRAQRAEPRQDRRKAIREGHFAYA